MPISSDVADQLYSWLVNTTAQAIQGKTSPTQADPAAQTFDALSALTTPGAQPTGGSPSAGAAPTPPAGSTPISIYGDPSTQDSPDAWFAKAVLDAYNMAPGAARDARFAHLLAGITGPNGPQGSLKDHYLKFIQGVMGGVPDKIAEAKLYATNPSHGGTGPNVV